MPSATSFGRTSSATASIASVISTGSDFAADVHVGSEVRGLVHAPEGRIVAVALQRLAVHHEQAHVAVARRRQALLGDDVAVAEIASIDLVEVGRLVVARRGRRRLPPEPCSGLSTARPPCSSTNALIASGSREISVRGRTRFGEVLEVGLVQRVGEARRVVHHEHAALDARAGRRAPPDVAAHGRSAASSAGSLRMNEHVEVVDAEQHRGRLRSERPRDTAPANRSGGPGRCGHWSTPVR